MSNLQDAGQMSPIRNRDHIRFGEFTFTFNLSTSLQSYLRTNSAKFTFYTSDDFPIVQLLTGLGVTIEHDQEHFFTQGRLANTIFQLEKKIIDIRTIAPYALAVLSPGDLLGIQGFIRLTRFSLAHPMRFTLELRENYYRGQPNYDLLNRLQRLNLSLSQPEIADDAMVPLLIPQTINNGFTYKVAAVISPNIKTIDAFAENAATLFAGLARIDSTAWKNYDSDQIALQTRRAAPQRLVLAELPDASSAVAGSVTRGLHYSYGTTTLTATAPSTAYLGCDITLTGSTNPGW